MLRHPVNFNHHQRLIQLLTDLGSSSSEIQKYKPTPGEVSAALLKRASLASAAASTSFAERIPATSSGLMRPADNKGILGGNSNMFNSNIF